MSPAKCWLTGLIITVSTLTFISFTLLHFAQDHSLRNWYNGAQGYMQATRTQLEQTKPMAVFFYTDWCKSCEALRKTVLATQQVNDYMQTLIPVKINPELGPAEQAIADSFGVFGYPTFVIIPNADTPPIRIIRTANVTPEAFIKQCQDAITTQL